DHPRAALVPERLEPLVTTATRTPTSVRTLGTATDFLDAAEAARRQVSSLADLLGDTSGSPLFSSGAPGGSTALFLRGANSNQTLFLVDGLRLNDPNTDYAVFLGGACLAACDSLEIAHGPQSTLYGGEAIGGVVSLRAGRGAGDPRARAALELGSFGTVQAAATAQGERGASAYHVAVQGGHTDNERPHNAFASANTTVRLDHTLNERVAIGGTLRWFHGDYESPGDRYTNDPDNREQEDNLLVTTFVNFRPATAWRTRVTLGGQDRRFVSTNPGPTGTAVTVVKNRRGVLDWQTTWTGAERHRVTAGFTAEANHTRNTGFGDINERQQLVAVFVQDEFSPADHVHITAGLRSDDFDTFGRQTTGRVTAAWLLAQERVKLRGSYGTAFRSPSFLDLYGRSASYVGNPGLRPETARGGDAGVDFYLADAHGTFGITWFENRFRDLIVYDFAVFPSTVANVERARTRGIEVKADLKVDAATRLQLAYTGLEADNLTQSTRLLRRPRYALGADLGHEWSERFNAGVGIRWVAQREDVDAATFRTVDGEDYTVMRIYAAWTINPRLTLRARVENLLDERYDEVNGYPQPGVGAYVGVEWRF
ncbi:MAG: TonB-dependent receptor plug domain-containing protein, partial [Cephaloticoccus sp.]